MMKKMTVIAVVAMIATPAAAQQAGMQMDRTRMDMSGPFAAAEMNMHDKMMAARGANDAETYTRKLIEHHRGAISMSQIALRETRDPRTRTTAQKVIAVQTKEIAGLQTWLRSNGKRPQ